MYLEGIEAALDSFLDHDKGMECEALPRQGYKLRYVSL